MTESHVLCITPDGVPTVHLVKHHEKDSSQTICEVAAHYAVREAGITSPIFSPRTVEVRVQRLTLLNSQVFLGVTYSVKVVAPEAPLHKSDYLSLRHAALQSIPEQFHAAVCETIDRIEALTYKDLLIRSQKLIDAIAEAIRE